MPKINFLNCKIDISAKVFFPRPETEFWVGKAIKEIKNQKLGNENLHILDIFAGSGCIGIAILKNIENTIVDFADISKEALEEIKTNLQVNKIQKNRYRILKSNIFEKLEKNKYNFIFANPPYVALNRIKEVDENVLEKEPHLALFAGKDGLKIIKVFLKEAKEYLDSQGRIFLEFDPLQVEELKKILRKEKYKFSLRKDQFGKIRWLEASLL
ncbi:MAG TPA: HemK/PrmC family methyltransferase [Candidatus Pacearchaeota archaeon]|nr:HemK/PrmC family methyltransferase [Candidatus Pacearchaeota archaeon]HOK94081.1 HemK/PrmC family methyltransferase [Candidatus Pacearchaeota archaeon]HPO75152.1 HemK/PrmC family methyltransferase [Candidatus Pacearchaeota archaeon]